MKLLIKNKKVIYIIFVLSLILLFFVYNNYQIEKRPEKVIKIPPQISGECGMENCHGLDITCGSDVQEVCNEMYMAGDNCRQFASCQIIDGNCELKESVEFKNCKSCVEECEQDFQDDLVKFFECESSCSE